MFETALELYNKLVNIYKTQYDKLTESNLNVPEKLPIELYLDELLLVPPLEDDEELKLEPEETITKRTKLNPWKRKATGTGLRIFTPNKLLTRFPILSA